MARQIERNYDTDIESMNVMSEARSIPSIPVYPIPEVCSFDYCSETPKFTMNGKGLCDNHFHVMCATHMVKISIV